MKLDVSPLTTPYITPKTAGNPKGNGPLYIAPTHRNMTKQDPNMDGLRGSTQIRSLSSHLLIETPLNWRTIEVENSRENNPRETRKR